MAGELPLRGEMIQPLGVFRRLMRSVSQRLKNMLVIGCISLYVKAGSNWRSRSSPPQRSDILSLPDHVLDMIFVSLPLTSLMAARCVCKKWRYLMTTPHFIKLRSKDSSRTPWLFLFSCYAGEVHALDISLNQWHRISHHLLKERDQCSVMAAGSDLYIVGGCSLIRDSALKSERSYREVLVFSPLTCSWREAAPMKSPRSTPALGFFEVPTDRGIVIDNPNGDANENGQSGGIHEKFAVIVVGGFGPENQPLDTGEIYDPISNKWIDIASLPKEFGAVCSGAVCGGVFYVYSESYRLASYNLEGGYWVPIQISSTPCCLQHNSPKLELVCCSGRRLFLCVSWVVSVFYEKEMRVKELWELDLTTEEVTILPYCSNFLMDRNVFFTADGERIYSLETSQNSGNVVEFITLNKVNSLITSVNASALKWKRIVPTRVIHKSDVSLHSTKSIAILHL